MRTSTVLKHCRWWSNRQIAEKHFGHATQLMASQDSSDIQSALELLDSALKLWPQWEKALELKARALLYLKRFKDVVNMLQDYIPGRKFHTYEPDTPARHREKIKLLSNDIPEDKTVKSSYLKYCVSKLRKQLVAGLSKACEREQWRYVVLGQACCHLGMMEDAMVLLHNGKRAAAAAFRRKNSCMREDSFCSDFGSGSESDLLSHLLANIKLLLRRRAAALASLEAGHYTESVRHFSKIVDGKRGTPQCFIAECYMQRAIAYQGAGRLIDAIADCNRTLVLIPKSVEALSARASIFEMVRCFAECLKDLEQLKTFYETLLRCQNVADPMLTRFHQSNSDADLHGNLQYVKNKIITTRQKLASQIVVDYHMVLGLARGCSRSDVERAYLLISLKHRPEKAAHFVDRCELVDDRDIETVREEARSSGFRLFRLIQEAYTGVLSAIVDEEMKREKRLRINMESKKKESTQPVWHQCLNHDSTHIEQDHHTSSCGRAGKNGCLKLEDGNWFDNNAVAEQLFYESGSTRKVEFEVLCGFNRGFVGSSSSSSSSSSSCFSCSSSCSPEELALIAVAACRELANESWIGTNEWRDHLQHHHLHHHQAHLTPRPLSVT